MSIVRLGGGLVSDEFTDEPDPGARFRVGTIPPEDIAADERQAAADAIESQAPPEVKTGDLPPARAQMMRLNAWLADLQGQLADLQRGRAALLAKLGIPTQTEADLVALEEADRSGLLAWMRSGAAAVLPNLAREHERALLREKLQQDSYTAQTAQAALDAAEAQADLLLRQIEIVTRRRDAAARAALVEHAAASAMGVKYMAAIAALEAALTPLMALANVVGDVHADGNPDKRFRSFYEDTFRARLPTFALAGIPGQWDAVSTQWTSDSRKVAVEVDDEMVSRAVEPWRRLLQLWVANPRAKPPAGV